MFQIEMISLDDLVPPSHQYRKFQNSWNWDEIHLLLKDIESSTFQGYGPQKLFSCLILQFTEDISDRESERYLQENNSAKWFCGFSLAEKTPDHTVFSRFRQKIGTKRLSKIFTILKQQLQRKGFMCEAFSVVDATHLIAKSSLWDERDKLIKKKIQALNNNTIPKVSHDKQARIGCKGKSKFWYGYK